VWSRATTPLYAFLMCSVKHQRQLYLARGSWALDDVTVFQRTVGTLVMLMTLVILTVICVVVIPSRFESRSGTGCNVTDIALPLSP
jgi:hypothetical protein